MNLLFCILFILTTSIFPQNILINQIGYLTQSTKYVYFTHSADSFFICKSINNEVVYKNKIKLRKENDPATGMILYRGDFSDFCEKGKFYVMDNYGNRSFDFEISDTVFSELFRKALKSYYFQRCGTDLGKIYAGNYSRTACHLKDAYFHQSTGISGFKSVTGGWHDAGDYGKYIVNAGITVETLLMAYELFPEKFSFDKLNIPESFNNIPDLLDEVRYELEWMMKMQNSDGSVFSKVTGEKFENFIMPHEDSLEKRYIYQISSTATANFAAVMARAYRVYKNFDVEFSSQCLKNALKAWNYLELHPDIFPLGGFRNPEGTLTGEYGDEVDWDERLLASIELYYSDGDEKFLKYYEENFNKKDLFTTINWGDVRTIAHITYLTARSINKSENVNTLLRNSFQKFCNEILSKCSKDGFGISVLSGDYHWGSNSDVLNNAIILLMGYEIFRNKTYYEFALNQLNYVLGINAHNISFITGIGNKSVLNPHHRPSAADEILEPIPGLLAGGPNQFLQDPVLQKKFGKETPPALCYVDDVGSWSSNEIAINWNAPLVFVSGYFNNNVK